MKQRTTKPVDRTKQSRETNNGSRFCPASGRGDANVRFRGVQALILLALVLCFPASIYGFTKIEGQMPRESGMVFPGEKNSYMDMDLDGITLEDEFSFECWIWISSDDTNGRIMQLVGNDGRIELRMQQHGLVGESIVFEMSRDRGLPEWRQDRNLLAQNWTPGRLVEVLEPDRWHHFAVSVKADQSKRFFIDGEHIHHKGAGFRTRLPVPEEFTFADLTKCKLGAPFKGDGFAGRISEVRLWDHYRTQSEIQNHMHRSLSSNEEGLIGYWPLNGNDRIVEDLANGQHGRTFGGVKPILAEPFETDVESRVLTTDEVETLKLGPVALRNRAGDVSYQWYRNHEPIKGATGNSLTVPDVNSSDAGIYYVKVDDERSEPLMPVTSKRVLLIDAAITDSAVATNDVKHLYDSLPSGKKRLLDKHFPGRWAADMDHAALIDILKWERLTRDVAEATTNILREMGGEAEKAGQEVAPGFFNEESKAGITNLLHPEMTMEIGYPAVIKVGAPYPDVEINPDSTQAGTLECRIVAMDDGSVMKEIEPKHIGANDRTTVEFSEDTASVPGKYRLEIELSDDGELLFTSSYYFTVGVEQMRSHLPETGNFSRIVFPGDDGGLVYIPDYRGNRIPDFSTAGYRYGEHPIPDAKVQVTLQPRPGDDTERIQKALDKVGDMPLGDDGLRGAVLLREGVYEISSRVRIRNSGVVLRGEGQGDFKKMWDTPASRNGSTDGYTLKELKDSLQERDKEATVLIMTGERSPDAHGPFNLAVGGQGGGMNIQTETTTEILTRYVPVGAKTFRIKHAEHFEAGDQIIIHRDYNEAWIEEVGVASGRDKDRRGRFARVIKYENLVTAVDGNQIEVKHPLFNAIAKKWGGGKISKYKAPGRIRRSGVENLRGIAFWKYWNRKDKTREYLFNNWDIDKEQAPPERFIRFDNVANGWMRNVTMEHFWAGPGTVTVGGNNVTVKHCSSLLLPNPSHPHPNYLGWGGYGYTLGGEGALVSDSYAVHHRHAFTTGNTGPFVILNTVSEKVLSGMGSQPHQDWRTGGLFDNVEADIQIMYRQGFAGANHVAWNTSRTLNAQKPPTAQNWAIGHIGGKEVGRHPVYLLRRFGRHYGFWESFGQHVEPESLYLQQLKERVGTEVLQERGYLKCE